MQALAGDEVGATGETLPAFLTLVGPFSCVDHLMVNQAGAPSKALHAYLTVVGPFPSVQTPVGDELGSFDSTSSHSHGTRRASLTGGSIGVRSRQSSG